MSRIFISQETEKHDIIGAADPLPAPLSKVAVHQGDRLLFARKRPAVLTQPLPEYDSYSYPESGPVHIAEIMPIFLKRLKLKSLALHIKGGEIESPIEDKFLWAFCDVIDIQTLETFQVEVHKQYKIGPYRADFYISIESDKAKASRIVECDGYGFHHATTEQIERDEKRDAYMEAKGFKVVRFMGRSIFRNAWECAQTVLDALLREANESV